MYQAQAAAEIPGTAPTNLEDGVTEDLMGVMEEMLENQVWSLFFISLVPSSLYILQLDYELKISVT